MTVLPCLVTILLSLFAPAASVAMVGSAIALDTPNTDATESAANVETVFDALLPFAEANSPATVHDCVATFQIVL